MVEQTFPEDLGVTCDEYKGNRKEFHSMAEIPREYILETFLLKQTDLALEFFLSSVYSIAHHNELSRITYKFLQKLFLEETNLANGTSSWKQ